MRVRDQSNVSRPLYRTNIKVYEAFDDIYIVLHINRTKQHVLKIYNNVT